MGILDAIQQSFADPMIIWSKVMIVLPNILMAILFNYTSTNAFCVLKKLSLLFDFGFF